MPNIKSLLSFYIRTYLLVYFYPIWVEFSYFFGFFLIQKRFFSQKIQDLKIELRNLQVEDRLFSGLSDPVLDFYEFLQRNLPTTGPSSIFNGLIK